jgi:hypothetical protein
MQTTQSTNHKLQTQNQPKYSFIPLFLSKWCHDLIHIYLYIIYFALCAILRRAYAVYIAAGVVEAKTAASPRPHRLKTRASHSGVQQFGYIVW